MKKVYEIYEVDSYGRSRCAVASSYKKAIEYVLANTDQKVEGIKINGEWTYCNIEKCLKTPQKDITIFGKCSNYGYYSNEFRIITTKVI